MTPHPTAQPRSFFVRGYLTVAGWIAATGLLSFFAATWHIEIAFLALMCVVVATFTAYQLSQSTLERSDPSEEVDRSNRVVARQFVGRAGLSSRRIS